MSNEKQMGIAVMQYLQDYDEHYMEQHENEGSGDPIASYYWFQPLQPYIKSIQVFRCPSSTDRATATSDPATPSDYVANGLIAHGTAQAAFQNTAEQIIASERGLGASDIDYHPWDYLTPPSGDPAHPGNEFDDHIAKDRHLGGSNYLFADGHVKWLRWEKTIAAIGDSPQGLGMHNRDKIGKPAGVL